MKTSYLCLLIQKLSLEKVRGATRLLEFLFILRWRGTTPAPVSSSMKIFEEKINSFFTWQAVKIGNEVKIGGSGAGR